MTVKRWASCQTGGIILLPALLIDHEYFEIIDKIMQQNVTNSGLTEHETQIIDALLSYPNRTQAAAAAGCSRATIYRALARDDFRQALAIAQRSSVEESTTRLIGLVGDAVATVDEIRQTGTNGDATRLKAASFIISTAVEMHANAVASARLDALERLIANQDL